MVFEEMRDAVVVGDEEAFETVLAAHEIEQHRTIRVRGNAVHFVVRRHDRGGLGVADDCGERRDVSLSEFDRADVRGASVQAAFGGAVAGEVF